VLASLGENGKAGIVMPNGVLFRSRSEKKIRKEVIKQDLIESVIALPKNLFYNTASPACILILNKNKPSEREEEILFINAQDEEVPDSEAILFEEIPNKSQSRLTHEGLEYLSETHQQWREKERHSRAAHIDIIEANDWNLNVPRYVDTTEPEEPIDVSEKLKGLEKLEEERNKTDEELQKYMEELDYK
jgi:type I restriction enzyme M protein